MIITVAKFVAQPAVIFTDPAVAFVGLTEKAANASRIKFKRIIVPVKPLGGMLHAEGYADGWSQ